MVWSEKSSDTTWNRSWASPTSNAAVVMCQPWPAMLVERRLFFGEAICYFPEEGNKKSSRKILYEMYYFRTRDAIEIVTGVT